MLVPVCRGVCEGGEGPPGQRSQRVRLCPPARLPACPPACPPPERPPQGTRRPHAWEPGNWDPVQPVSGGAGSTPSAPPRGGAVLSCSRGVNTRVNATRPTAPAPHVPHLVKELVKRDHLRGKAVRPELSQPARQVRRQLQRHGDAAGVGGQPLLLRLLGRRGVGGGSTGAGRAGLATTTRPARLGAGARLAAGARAHAGVLLRRDRRRLRKRHGRQANGLGHVMRSHFGRLLSAAAPRLCLVYRCENGYTGYWSQVHLPFHHSAGLHWRCIPSCLRACFKTSTYNISILASSCDVLQF